MTDINIRPALTLKKDGEGGIMIKGLVILKKELISFMLENLKKNLANNKEIYFKVKVIVGASKTELKTIMSDGVIKIALVAAPEKGEANKALINYLAKELEVRKYQVQIISGLTDKLKVIKVTR